MAMMQLLLVLNNLTMIILSTVCEVAAPVPTAKIWRAVQTEQTRDIYYKANMKDAPSKLY